MVATCAKFHKGRIHREKEIRSGDSIIARLFENDFTQRRVKIVRQLTGKIVQSCRAWRDLKKERRPKRKETRISVSGTRFSDRCIEVTRQLSNKVRASGVPFSRISIARP